MAAHVACSPHISSRGKVFNPAQSLLQAVNSRGRPVCDADYQPRRTRYENTGQLQLLHKSYQYGTPSNTGVMENPRLVHTQQETDYAQELTQQLKVPLYKQLIGNTAMVDLSSLSANPQVMIMQSLLSDHWGLPSNIQSPLYQVYYYT